MEDEDCGISEEDKKLLLDDLPTIQNECESLVTKIDTIYAGLGKVLNQSSEDTSEENGSEEQS